MINALEVPSDIDLAAFGQFLAASGVRHRITEEGLNQVVWVASDMEASFVQSAYGQYQSGQLPLPETIDSKPADDVAGKVAIALLRFPLTLGLIVLAVAFFPAGMGLESGSAGPLVRQLLFLGSDQMMGNYYFLSLGETLAAGEYWRLITPMFIHFSVLHLVFNLLWVWEIGRRIEFENGAAMLLSVTLFSSFTANLLQYLMTGPSLFGGMSGVVFGFLGFAFVWSSSVPSRSHRVQKGIYIFMMIYLIIGFSGAIDLLGLGSLANGAHLGGLIGGAIAGGLAGLLARPSPPRRH